MATVTVDQDRCVSIYPMPDWQDIELKLMGLPTLDPQVKLLKRLMVGNASEIDLDANGRMLLPPNLREYGQLTRDAVLVGQGWKFELWDESRWNEQQQELLASPVTLNGLSPELAKLVL